MPVRQTGSGVRSPTGTAMVSQFAAGASGHGHPASRRTKGVRVVEVEHQPVVRATEIGTLGGVEQVPAAAIGVGARGLVPVRHEESAGVGLEPPQREAGDSDTPGGTNTAVPMWRKSPSVARHKSLSAGSTNASTRHAGSYGNQSSTPPRRSGLCGWEANSSSRPARQRIQASTLAPSARAAAYRSATRLRHSSSSSDTHNATFPEVIMGTRAWAESVHEREVPSTRGARRMEGG